MDPNRKYGPNTQVGDVRAIIRSFRGYIRYSWNFPQDAMMKRAESTKFVHIDFISLVSLAII